jgi:hypothetical protein
MHGQTVVAVAVAAVTVVFALPMPLSLPCPCLLPVLVVILSVAKDPCIFALLLLLPFAFCLLLRFLRGEQRAFDLK